MSNIQQTLIIIKPGAITAGKAGSILSLLEDEGYQIKNLLFRTLQETEIQQLYPKYRNQPLFQRLLAYMTSSPAMILEMEGIDIIEECRKLIGNTDPTLARKGTIRQKYGHTITDNAIHASNSIENANYEIHLFFK